MIAEPSRCAFRGLRLVCKMTLTIEVLGSDDQHRQEDPMARRLHAMRDLWQPSTKAVEVDEGAEKGRNLDVALVHEYCDEGFQRGGFGLESWELAPSRGCGRRRWCFGGGDLDDFDGLLGDVG